MPAFNISLINHACVSNVNDITQKFGEAVVYMACGVVYFCAAFTNKNLGPYCVASFRITPIKFSDVGKIVLLC